MKVSFHDQISKNKRDSLLLMLIVFSILTSLTYLLGYIFAPGFSSAVVVFAIIFSIIYIFATYRYGDKVVLSTVGAKKVDPGSSKYAHLVNTVEGLSLAAGIPKPDIYIIESNDLNAFATGRNPENASVAVTTGLLNVLDREELEGVIAHELSHIKNYDIRFGMIVAVMVGLIGILSYMFRRSVWFSGGSDRKKRGGLVVLVGLLLAVFAPIIVRLVQLAISRRREYLADSSAVELTRYPDGLADALEKIMNHSRGDLKVSEAMSHIFFIDPNKSSIDNLFATHPPIDKRIKALRSM